MGTYRAPRAMLLLLPAGFLVAVLVGVTMFVGDSPTLAGPLRWFPLVWFAGLLWNAYWWFFRIAYGAGLNQFTLRWRCIGRSGEIPLEDLTNVRPSRLAPSIQVIEHRNGKLLLFVRKGLGPFLEQLAMARPELPIRVGRFAQSAERRQGPLWGSWWHPEESAAQL